MTTVKTESDSTYTSYQLPKFGGKFDKVQNELPTPSGSEVLLRVNFCGVCHSDVHVHEGHYNLGQGRKLDLGARGITLPVTLGHEIVGTVAAVGPDAKGVELGQQMLVYPWIGCGECAVCERGEENLCTKPASLGIFKPGGYAEYVSVPHSRYLADLGNLEPAHASLLACSGLTTFSAIKKIGPIHSDESVVVIGCGGLGLLAIRTLELSGAKNIIAVDISEAKRNLALEAGAKHVIDPKSADVVSQITQASNSKNTAILDFVGSTETVALGLDVVQKGGKVIVVGLHGGEINYPIPFLITKAITLIGSYTGTLTEMRELITFANQHKNLISLPIKIRKLDEAEAALHDLSEGKVEGRVVLDAS